MRKLSSFLCFVSLLFVSLGPVTFAADSGALGDKITVIENKLARIKTLQEQLIQKQDEIDHELENLRIWLHRNP